MISRSFARPLQVLIALVVCATVSSIWRMRYPTEEGMDNTLVAAAPSKKGLSIQGVILGTPRTTVEGQYGGGQELQGRVVYGDSWTAPPDGEPHYWLEIEYDPQQRCRSVSGSALHKDGEVVRIAERGGELVGFGKPASTPIAVWTDSDQGPGSSMILDYQERLGLSVEVVNLEKIRRVHFDLSGR